MNKLFLNFIIKDKVRYFSFLFGKGFKLRNFSNLLESFGNWFVEFESPNCLILIYSDRDEVFVTIYPDKTDKKNTMGLELIIYYLTNGRIFIGNFTEEIVGGIKKRLERTAVLLEEYIDQIIPYCGHEFQNIKEDLRLSNKRYWDHQSATYKKKF
jgi:hypothetical protein